MKLSELSGAHIGSQVTIKTTYATITGTLYSIASDARRIFEANLGGVESATVSGLEVCVKVGAFESGRLDGAFECEVHEK